MPAKESAEWKGDLPTGFGTFTAGDTISRGYTYKSRFEDGPGSNPEQLIAAAEFSRKAKEGCPVSRALAGVPEITLDATLLS